MPVHTVKAARAYENALGFEDFLVHVEGGSHPAHRKNSRAFRKVFTFRNGAGRGEEMVRRLSGNLHATALVVSRRSLWPEFLSNDVRASLNYMSAQTASIMESAPRSTGGSGFGGGGGFSGGGFGGGGGGGF